MTHRGPFQPLLLFCDMVWPEWENNCTIPAEGNALHGVMQNMGVTEEELVRVTSWFNFQENT